MGLFLISKDMFLFHSSQQLPCLIPGPLRAFCAETATYKGPRLASCIAFETADNQGHSQVCGARRGGPRTPSRTTDAHLDGAFVENTLALVFTKMEGRAI